MAEEFDNLITLADQDGEEVDFEILDIVPYGGDDYAVLLPLDDDSDAPEAVILKILPSAGDSFEDTLVGIEDEAVLGEVFSLFMQRNADAPDDG